MYKQEYFNHLLHNSYINTFNSLAYFSHSLSLPFPSFLFSNLPIYPCSFIPRIAVVKNPPARAGVTGDLSWISWSGRSPGGGHGNPFQYSYLENPMDGGAWWAKLHRVAHRQDMTEATQHSISISTSFNIFHPSCSLSHIHGFSLGKCM